MKKDKKNTKEIPVIDFAKCTRCKKCIDACPNKAIIASINNTCAKCVKYCSIMEAECPHRDIVFNYEQCDLCGQCLKVCPENAIYWLKVKSEE